MIWSCSMRLNTAKIMNKVWTKELLFDILIMFNTIWQETTWATNTTKNNASMSHCDCRAPVFALAGCSLQPRKIRVFVWIQCAFPCFLSGEEGGGRRFFVNEGEHAGGREAARGLAAGVAFGLQYAEWQRIAWWLRAIDGCWWRWGNCYMLHVTCYIKRSRNSRKGVKK